MGRMTDFSFKTVSIRVLFLSLLKVKSESEIRIPEYQSKRELSLI